MENLPQERLVIAVGAVSTAEAILETTIEYCNTRKAFGQTIGSFQNTRFALAEMATEVDVTRVYIDRCIAAHVQGELSGVEAAKAKLWATDMVSRVVNRCLQLHGGYGYMLEYPVARAYTDTRVQSIYGGTNEIMKEIIGRTIAP
jgi:alkylation response protein AidB-like acyl-CoA dehydrogenase